MKTLLFFDFGDVKRFLFFFFSNLVKLPNFTRFSPGFHQVYGLHQVFTKFVDFTRFSPSLWISPNFHQVSHVVNQVFEFQPVSLFSQFHQIFTRFSPSFWIFTRLSNLKQFPLGVTISPGFHQVFTRFSPGFTRFSPGF